MRATLLVGLMMTLLLGACARPFALPAERNKVYILGSVKKQVMVEYRKDMTLLEALSYAQFPDYDAMQSYVRWVDKSGPLIVKRHFSYSALVTGGASNAAVHPGDIIFVYQNPFFQLLNFVERLLRPVRVLLTPVTAASTGAAGIIGTAIGATRSAPADTVPASP